MSNQETGAIKEEPTPIPLAEFLEELHPETRQALPTWPRRIT